MKSRLHNYEISRPRPRNGHKYATYKMCVSIMMVTCIKLNLSNICSSIHEKLSNTEAELNKSLLIKRCSSNLSLAAIIKMI